MAQALERRMRWLTATGLVLLAPAAARADGPTGEVYTTRQFDADKEPKVGEVTALGQYSHAGNHMGAKCYRDQATAELAFAHDESLWANPGARDSHFHERLFADGREFIVPYGTPVTVVRKVAMKRAADSSVFSFIVVRFDGGPRQGSEAVVYPHQVLRRRTKEEIVVEGRAPPLPGYSGKLGYSPKVGDLAMLGYLDVKAGTKPGPYSPVQYLPVLRQGVPAFTRLADFRDYFAVKKEPLPGEKPSRSRALGTLLPPTTDVYVRRLIPAEAEVPAAAEVVVGYGPLKGQEYIVPAANLLKSGGQPGYLPVGHPTFIPDYSPETDRHPAKHRSHPGIRTPADAAKPGARPAVSTAKAATLLSMARGSEKAGRPAVALGYYREILEKFPESIEADEARKKVKEFEPH